MRTRGTQHERHRDDARGRAEAEQQQQPDVAADARDVGPPSCGAGGAAREHERARRSTTTLFTHGRERGGDEPPVRVEQRGRRAR